MLTRRDFMTELAGVAMAAATIAPVVCCATESRTLGAVVSIHMDQPYIDATGRAIPYRPPDGMRSAEPMAHLSEAEFRSRHIYS